MNEERKTNMVNQCICQYVIVAGQLSKSQTLLLWWGVRRRVLSRTPHVAGEVRETGRVLFCLTEKQYEAQRKDWWFGLVDAYVAWTMSLNTQTFQTLGSMIVAGGKHGKKGKERTRAGSYYERSRRSDVAEKNSTHVQQGEFEEAREAEGHSRRNLPEKGDYWSKYAGWCGRSPVYE